jgi:hypothetical protein
MEARLADLLLYLHLGYVAVVLLVPPLVLLGGWRGWDWVRWPWLRCLHLGMIAVPVLEALVGYPCPLTTWEHELRWAAGEPQEALPLMTRLARELLYVEASIEQLVPYYVGFLTLVLSCFWLVPPRRRPARPAGLSSAPAKPG